MSTLCKLACALLALAPLSARAQVPGFCAQYNDKDHDGYVYGLTGRVCPRDDCDDENPSIHPGATEICGDGVDQDCDGFDLACPGVDDDGDGHRARAAGGDDCDDHDAAVHPGRPEVCGDGKDNDCAGGDLACPSDEDHDGYPAVAAGGTDCNDHDPSVHPHAAEVCGDGVDQDCAAGDPPCQSDADRDGYPNAATGGNDCDDFDAATHPGAPEVCGDGRDQDCDGADLACPDRRDLDGDGHVSAMFGGDDCDDRDPATYRGAPEICDDERDQDCDGRDISCNAAGGDGDGDGVAGPEAGGTDCDDANAAIYPGAPEICGDGRDQDCDGRDAELGVDAICEAAPTTDPLFDQFRYDSKLRKSSPETSSSCTSGGTGALWLAALVLLWRRRR